MDTETVTVISFFSGYILGCCTVWAAMYLSFSNANKNLK